MNHMLQKAIWIAAGITLAVTIGIGWMYTNMNAAATTGTSTVNKALQNSTVQGN